MRPPSVRPFYTNKTSKIWSGWMDLANTNVELYSVAAQFKVPTTTCTAAGAAASFWVGLDGWGNSTVEQAGVDAYCDIKLPSGGYAPHYYDWYEMYPNNTVAEFYVSPGDTIDASVSYNPNDNKYYLQIDDTTHPGDNFSASAYCPGGYTCHKASAEVIAEDPGGGAPNGVNLANFGTVNFGSIQVISRNGTIGTLEGNNIWSANKITMEYPGTTVMAQPSDRTGSTNNAFSDTYKSAG
jgi:hypothetical protein